jgi:hypothetical protein
VEQQQGVSRDIRCEAIRKAQGSVEVTTGEAGREVQETTQGPVAGAWRVFKTAATAAEQEWTMQQPRMIDTRNRNITVADILKNSGKSVAAVARICKTSLETVQGWLGGSAPRYKYAPGIAKATGVDESVVFDAVKRANQESRHSVPIRVDKTATAKTDCQDAVVDQCLVALDLASRIVCLDNPQQDMICSIVEALSNDQAD